MKLSAKISALDAQIDSEVRHLQRSFNEMNCIEKDVFDDLTMVVEVDIAGLISDFRERRRRDDAAKIVQTARENMKRIDLIKVDPDRQLSSILISVAEGIQKMIRDLELFHGSRADK